MRILAPFLIALCLATTWASASLLPRDYACGWRATKHHAQALLDTASALAQGKHGFRLVEYAGAGEEGIDEALYYVEWAYDAFGRKAMETVYTGAKSLEVDSQTLYTYDGWRALAETGVKRHAMTGAVESVRNRAEYVYGPGYIDDVVASYRDTSGDGDYGDASELRYHLTDQQYSTVALLDAAGAVVERYGYDAFGAPTIYNPAGTAIPNSAVSNAVLYTGRPWMGELGAYDLRNRHYAPSSGRFLTTDAVFDAANLGNPYTYVGNNPFAYVDPMGEERWGTQSYGAEVLDVGAGMLFGAVDMVVGAVEAALSPVETARGVAEFAGQMIADAPGTVGGIASHFYAQFEDSDSAGQAAGAVVSSLAPGGVAGKAATAGRAVRAAESVADAAGDAGKAARVGRMQAGRAFDKVPPTANRHGQVYVDTPDGRRVRLDWYNDRAGEIISRKNSQLGNVQEGTAKRYIDELPRKYTRGATISDVPSNRDRGLAGKRLEGDYVLEIPVQNSPVPQGVLDHATGKGVVIRDVTGRRYK